MIQNIASIYLAWVLVHYLTPHLYVRLCVPATPLGLILSPLYVPTQHCRAMRWAIYEGGEIIVTMWIVLGNWFIRNMGRESRYYVDPERKNQ